MKKLLQLLTMASACLFGADAWSATSVEWVALPGEDSSGITDAFSSVGEVALNGASVDANGVINVGSSSTKGVTIDLTTDYQNTKVSVEIVYALASDAASSGGLISYRDSNVRYFGLCRDSATKTWFKYVDSDGVNSGDWGAVTSEIAPPETGVKQALQYNYYAPYESATDKGSKVYYDGIVKNDASGFVFSNSSVKGICIGSLGTENIYTGMQIYAIKITIDDLPTTTAELAAAFKDATTTSSVTRSLTSAEEGWAEEEWGLDGTATAPVANTSVTLTATAEGGSKLSLDTATKVVDLTLEAGSPIRFEGSDLKVTRNTVVNVDADISGLTGTVSLGAVTIAEGVTLTIDLNKTTFTSITGGGQIAAFVAEGVAPMVMDPSRLYTWTTPTSGTGSTSAFHAGYYTQHGTGTSLHGDTNRTANNVTAKNWTLWANANITKHYTAPGNVLRFVNGYKSGNIDAQFGPMTLGGLLVESGATGYSITGSGDRKTQIGDASGVEGYVTPICIHENFTINRTGENSSTEFSGAIRMYIAENKTFTFNTSNTTTANGMSLASGASLKLEGEGQFAFGGTLDLSGETVDLSNRSLVTSEDNFGVAPFKGAVTVDASTIIKLPAGVLPNTKYKLVEPQTQSPLSFVTSASQITIGGVAPSFSQVAIEIDSEGCFSYSEATREAAILVWSAEGSTWDAATEWTKQGTEDKLTYQKGDAIVFESSVNLNVGFDVNITALTVSEGAIVSLRSADNKSLESSSAALNGSLDVSNIAANLGAVTIAESAILTANALPNLPFTSATGGAIEFKDTTGEISGDWIRAYNGTIKLNGATLNAGATNFALLSNQKYIAASETSTLKIYNGQASNAAKVDTDTDATVQVKSGAALHFYGRDFGANYNTFCGDKVRVYIAGTIISEVFSNNLGCFPAMLVLDDGGVVQGKNNANASLNFYAAGNTTNPNIRVLENAAAEWQNYLYRNSALFIETQANSTLTLSALIKGNNGQAITKYGTGTLKITSAQTEYTGNTTINEGVVRLEGSGNFGSSTTQGTVTIADGARLELKDTTSVFKNTISGNGSIEVVSGSMNNLSAATFTQRTTVKTGATLIVTKGQEANVTLEDGATLQILLTPEQQVAEQTLATGFDKGEGDVTIEYGSLDAIGGFVAANGSTDAKGNFIPAVIKWIGGTSANWSDAQNWEGGVPTAQSTVEIPVTAATTITLPTEEPFAVAKILVVTAGENAVNPSLAFEDGSLTVSDSVEFAVNTDVSGIAESFGSATIDNGVVLTVGTLGEQTIAYSIAGEGGVNVNTGTVSLTNTANTYSGGTEIASGATLKITDMANIGGAGAEATIKGTLTYTYTCSSSAITHTADMSRFSGYGTLHLVGTSSDNSRHLIQFTPATKFDDTLSLFNEAGSGSGNSSGSGILLPCGEWATSEANPKSFKIRNLSGSGDIRNDSGNGTVVVEVTQTKKTEYNGYFYGSGSDRPLNLVVKGEGVDKTLKLNQSSSATFYSSMTIDASGSVELIKWNMNNACKVNGSGNLIMQAPRALTFLDGDDSDGTAWTGKVTFAPEDDVAELNNVLQINVPAHSTLELAGKNGCRVLGNASSITLPKTAKLELLSGDGLFSILGEGTATVTGSFTLGYSAKTDGSGARTSILADLVVPAEKTLYFRVYGSDGEDVVYGLENVTLNGTITTIEDNDYTLNNADLIFEIGTSLAGAGSFIPGTSTPVAVQFAENAVLDTAKGTVALDGKLICNDLFMVKFATSPTSGIQKIFAKGSDAIALTGGESIGVVVGEGDAQKFARGYKAVLKEDGVYLRRKGFMLIVK